MADMKSFLGKLFGESDSDQISKENTLLRERQFRQIEYIRNKTNQMLMLMGTLPLRPDELDDDSLLEVDPIGTMAEAFVQILEHEKELGERVRLARDEIQAIMSSVGVGIMVLDSNMHIQMHNQKVKELFALSSEQLVGKTCCQAICGRNSLPDNCTFERVMESRRPVHQVDWQNSGRHFDVFGTPVKNRLGDITHVVLAYSDITSRILTEQRLRDNEQMYLDIFEHANDIVQCVVADGSFLFVNRLWRETLGYSSDETIGLKIWNIIAPEHRKECMDLFNNLFKGERMGQVRTTFFSKSGREIPVFGNVSSSIVDGKPVASIGMFRLVNSESKSE
jgi:two-component system phosphate regulon sensor histidine kinase PhoR